MAHAELTFVIKQSIYYNYSHTSIQFIQFNISGAVMREMTFYNSHHVNPYSKHFCYYSIAVKHKYPVKHSQ
jgi:hypothetical protein